MTKSITPDSKWWDMELKRTEAMKESLDLIEHLALFGEHEAIGENYGWIEDTIKKLKEVLND